MCRDRAGDDRGLTRAELIEAAPYDVTFAIRVGDEVGTVLQPAERLPEVDRAAPYRQLPDVLAGALPVPVAAQDRTLAELEKVIFHRRSSLSMWYWADF